MVKVSGGGEKAASRKVRTVRHRQQAVTLFARQMATLLGAGLPILRSLETLIRQERNKAFRTVLVDVAERVRGGASFSEALGEYPRIFDHLLLNMVRAGEAGGNLAEVLERVADFREKAARAKGKVKAAMVYPLIVMSVAVVIVGLLMAFVVPQFQDIFQGMLRGQPLPPLTQAVIDVSEVVKHHWLWVILVLTALILAMRFGGRTPVGERLLDRIFFYCPGPRAIVQRSAISRFARTFGTLTRAGVPILDSLRITREVVGNAVVRGALDRVHDRVRDGDSIAAPLEDAKVFPAMVPSMIGVGEETGQLSEMCDRMADTYEEELDNVVAGLTSVIEPVMIVLLALVVGTVVIALFLPIVSIIQNLSTR